MPVIAGDGTTHAEPCRAARHVGSATPSLVGVHHAARCFRSVTGVRRPACEHWGRESSKTTRKSQTYFTRSRARGRESSNYVDAARGQMDVEIAARRPPRHSTYDGAGGRRPATRSRACATATSPCAPNESVASRQNGLLGGRILEMIYPVIYYSPGRPPH